MIRQAAFLVFLAAGALALAGVADISAGGAALAADKDQAETSGQDNEDGKTKNQNPVFGITGKLTGTDVSPLPDPKTEQIARGVEPCHGAGCACGAYRVTQRIMIPGQRPKGDRPFCDAPSGYNATRVGDTCMICPRGMNFSATLRDRAQILKRMNLNEDVCAFVQRMCI